MSGGSVEASLNIFDSSSLCHDFLNLRNHPDVPCYNVGQSDSNCIGAEFGVMANDGEWWNPQTKPHGTHVFGTIGASGKNNEGMQGIIPDGQVCYIIARVFGESGVGSSMSDST